MKIQAHQQILRATDSYIPPHARRGQSSTEATSPGAPGSVTISQAAQRLLAASTDDSSSGGNYDFTNMTSNQMQGVATAMWKSGEIDITQLRVLQMAGMPLGKVGANGELIPLSDAEKSDFMSKPLNYIQISKDQLTMLEQKGLASDPQYGYKMWSEILATLQNKQTASAQSA